MPVRFNRLHVLLTRLLPGGAPRDLDADTAAQLLRPIRPRETGLRTLRHSLSNWSLRSATSTDASPASTPRSPKPYSKAAAP